MENKTAAAACLAFPVTGAVITSPYGKRILNGKEQFHAGIDFVSIFDYQINMGLEKDLSKRDRSVYAVADGIINFDYDIYDERFRWLRPQDSVGNMVIQNVQIGGVAYSFRYCHLSENLVSNNQIVKQGEKIGVYADVGQSYGAHLHFDGSLGVFFDRSKIIDPTALFQWPGRN